MVREGKHLERSRGLAGPGRWVPLQHDAVELPAQARELAANLHGGRGQRGESALRETVAYAVVVPGEHGPVEHLCDWADRHPVLTRGDAYPGDVR